MFLFSGIILFKRDVTIYPYLFKVIDLIFILFIYILYYFKHNSFIIQSQYFFSYISYYYFYTFLSIPFVSLCMDYLELGKIT